MKLKGEMEMKKLLIVMIGVACASFALNADTFTWNTSSGDVNTAANWSPAQVPGPSDTANVKSGSASMSADFSVSALWIASDADRDVADFTQTVGALAVGSAGLIMGANGNSYARYFMKGGSLTIPGGQPKFGGWGYGLLRMTGGTISSAATWPTLGNSANASVFSAGVVDVRDGTFEQSDTGTRFCIGEHGFGLLSVGGNGVFRSWIPLWMGCYDNGIGRVVAKDGGLLEIAGTYPSGSSGEKFALFSGGTLKPCGTTGVATGFFSGIGTKVGAGGMTVDTADKALTLAAPIADAVGHLVQSNLVHRWSFNGGSLADSVGGVAATTAGSNTAGISTADNQITLPGGQHNSARVVLGDGTKVVLPDSPDGLTLEMWATLHSKTLNYDRMFSINRNTSAWSPSYLSLCWTTSNNEWDYFLARWNGGETQVKWQALADDALPHRIDREQHVAIVLAPGESGWTATLYRHDAESSQFIKSYSMTANSAAWTPASLSDAVIALGYSFESNPDSNASYNEVRVWNKALTADDLVRSAMLGPDADFTAKPSLVKTGVGSLTLAAGNTYAGATEVREGTLALGAVELPYRRWSFTNGSNKDSIAGSNMGIVGTLTFADGKVTLPGATHDTAYLSATGLFPDCSSTDGVTLEFYATLDNMLQWQRLFTMHLNRDLKTGICATWGWDTGAAGDQYKFRTNWGENDVLNVLATGSAPWIAGTEYHVSLVFAKTENGFDVTIARRNATTGAIIATKSTSVTWSPSTLASMDLRLGWSWDNSSDAAGKFDEVRVWNRALTEDEIVAGIKTGKDTLPPRASGVGAPTLPSGTSLSVASGATLLLCGASQTVANAALSGTVAGAGTLTATGGFNPGGDGTIGTMVIDGGAKLAGDVVLDFAANGSCDQLVFTAGGTYDVSAIRLVPSASGAAVLNTLQRFTIGNAADAVLTGSFDISAFPNAQVRQKPNGDLELLVPKGTVLVIR
jgi:autotransporter-associated beta strand protein